VAGKDRHRWTEIVGSARAFVKALSVKDWTSAVQAMNKEVDIRRQMTPEVFDDMGEALLEKARDHDCAARFTGAGGGGHMIFYCRPNLEDAVKQTLIKEGGEIVPFDFDFNGVRSWEAK